MSFLFFIGFDNFATANSWSSSSYNPIVVKYGLKFLSDVKDFGLSVLLYFVYVDGFCVEFN